MANLKATTYEELSELLGPRVCMTIGNNTTAERHGYTITVLLHGHPIVSLHRGNVSFTLAGYPTVTTRERINQFLPHGWAVVQRDGRQYLSDPDHNLTPIDVDTWIDPRVHEFARS